MTTEEEPCPIDGELAEVTTTFEDDIDYRCPNCGRFRIRGADRPIFLNRSTHDRRAGPRDRAKACSGR